MSWSAQTTPTVQGLFGVRFASLSAGWAVGANGTILRNNGSGWIAQSPPIPAGLNDIASLDGLTGWAVGNDGTILKTVNGGTTWASFLTGKVCSLDPQTPCSTDADCALGKGSCTRPNSTLPWIKDSHARGGPVVTACSLDPLAACFPDDPATVENEDSCASAGKGVCLSVEEAPVACQ